MKTIYDVAQTAGVSIATVSRVFNNYPGVRPETRRRVWHAVRSLNYHRSGIARSLARKQTQLIALIIPDIENPFYTTLAKGVEAEANSRGNNVVLCNSDRNPDKTIAYLEMLQESRVDGVLYASLTDLTDVVVQKLEELTRDRLPFVILDEEVSEVVTDTVLVDNDLGASLAVDHLIELGHRRIGYLGGPLEVWSAQARFHGFKARLKARRLDVRPEWIFHGDYGQESAYEFVSQLISRGSSLPSAFFAGGDLMAWGAIIAAEDAGVKVPHDLSVVGFDDSPFASAMRPRLTTVAQPSYDLGGTAVRLLIQRIKIKGSSEFQKVFLQPHLVVRESTSSPRPYVEKLAT